jgi:hypothetical protein
VEVNYLARNNLAVNIVLMATHFLKEFVSSLYKRIFKPLRDLTVKIKSLGILEICCWYP